MRRWAFAPCVVLMAESTGLAAKAADAVAMRVRAVSRMGIDEARIYLEMVMLPPVTACCAGLPP